MKNKIIALFLMGFSTFMFAQETKEREIHTKDSNTNHLKWEDNFDEAKEIASKQNKPLLLFFTGSDWCGPCKMLHKDFFESEKFVNLAKKELILYEADFPRRKDLLTPEKRKENYKLQSKYGVRGYPTIVILSSKGKELGRQKGYSFTMRDSEAHFTLINEVIKSNN